jgi:hypothetical protein
MFEYYHFCTDCFKKNQLKEVTYLIVPKWKIMNDLNLFFQFISPLQSKIQLQSYFFL